MADRARHAFGALSNVQSAMQAGTIDAYDILFLDGDTNPKVGWIDKNGYLRLVEDKIQVARVDELPVTDGDPDIVYIYNNEGYIWDGTKCVSMSKSADLTSLEDQVSVLESQMDTKVDEATVDSKIDLAVESAISELTGGEVVEF